MNIFCKQYLYFVLIIFSLKTFGQTENINKKSSLSRKTLKYSSSFDTYFYKGPINFIANLGIQGYNGAGNQEFNFKSPSMYGGLGVGYQLLTHTLFVFEANAANFKYSYMPNDNELVDFSVKNREFSLYSRIYLLSDRITKHSHTMPKNFRKIKFYLIAGLGTSMYKAKVSVNDRIVEDQKRPHYTFFVPLGLGLHYRYSDRLSFLCEFSRKTWYGDVFINNYTSGYHALSFKAQFNPWGAKRKRKIILQAPTTPTNFYSPNGVAPNKKRREEQNEMDVPPAEDTTLEGEEDPFGDF